MVGLFDIEVEIVGVQLTDGVSVCVHVIVLRGEGDALRLGDTVCETLIVVCVLEIVCVVVDR